LNRERSDYSHKCLRQSKLSPLKLPLPRKASPPCPGKAFRRRPFDPGVLPTPLPESQIADNGPGHRDGGGPIRRKCNFLAGRPDGSDRSLLDLGPIHPGAQDQKTRQTEFPDRWLQKFASSAGSVPDMVPRPRRRRECREGSVELARADKALPW